MMIITGIFSYATIKRNLDWKNEFQLFTTDVKTSENSSKANVNAAYVLINESQKSKNENLKKEYIELAEKYALKAISILPKNFQAHYQLGRIYNLKGDDQKARYYYELYNNFINAK